MKDKKFEKRLAESRKLLGDAAFEKFESEIINKFLNRKKRPLPEIDIKAWEALTKEQILQRKDDWKCIAKYLHEINIVFQGESYKASLKTFFMKGKLDDSAIDILEERCGGGDKFAGSFLFFYLWFHPSNDYDYLKSLMTPDLLKSVSHPKNDLGCKSLVDPMRIDFKYGRLGSKSEVLAKLIAPLYEKKYVVNDVEYNFYMMKNNMDNMLRGLGNILRGNGRRGPHFVVPNSFVCYLDFWLDDYYLLTVIGMNKVYHVNDSPQTIPNTKELFEFMCSMFKFYERRYKKHNYSINHKVRNRLFDKWKNREYCPELLASFDEVAEIVGYQKSWEDNRELFEKNCELP